MSKKWKIETKKDHVHGFGFVSSQDSGQYIKEVTKKADDFNKSAINLQINSGYLPRDIQLVIDQVVKAAFFLQKILNCVDSGTNSRYFPVCPPLELLEKQIQRIERTLSDEV